MQKSRGRLEEPVMRTFVLAPYVLLVAVSCISLTAQSSVSQVAFSESQDVVQAFSSAGSITLPVAHQLLDVSYPNGKKERGHWLSCTIRRADTIFGYTDPRTPQQTTGAIFRCFSPVSVPST